MGDIQGERNVAEEFAHAGGEAVGGGARSTEPDEYREYEYYAKGFIHAVQTYGAIAWNVGNAEKQQQDYRAEPECSADSARCEDARSLLYGE